MAAMDPTAESARPDDDLIELARFLHRRDLACPLCASNLRDLTSRYCPRCRRELCLSVGLAEPYVRAWVAMTSALCAMAGIGMWVLLMICKAGWPRSESGLFQLSIVVFLASIPLAILGIVKRKRMLRMPRGGQAALALTAIVALVASVGMFFSGIR